MEETFYEIPEEELEDATVVEDEPVKKTKKKAKKETTSRMKTVVVRAFVFSKPSVHSRSLAAINYGNLLDLLEEPKQDSDFYKIRVPRGENSVEGFVLKTKLKKV